jgi:hypothetical protein
MKKLISLLVPVLFVLQSFATDWTGIRSQQPVPGTKHLVSSKSIDLEGLNPGLYLLIAESNGQRVIRKIIKK